MFVRLGEKNRDKFGRKHVRETRFYHVRSVSTTYGFTEISYIDEIEGLTTKVVENNNIEYVNSYTDTVGMRNLIENSIEEA